MNYAQSLSRVLLFVTPCTIVGQAPLSSVISWSLLKFMSIELVKLSTHFILCHPLLLCPSVFPSIRVFSNGSAPWNKWPKYWSFSFIISPFNKYLGFISFWIDWFDLLAVQEAFKGILQHHNSAFLWFNSHICTWLLQKP